MTDPSHPVRPRAAAGLALLLLAAAPALAGGTVRRDTIGCRDRTVVERSARLQLAGDVAGFGALMADGVRSGACAVIKGGSRVRAAQADPLFECLVAVDGAGPCLWTPKGQTRP